MKGIEPCPTMEELEAKANAIFAEDVKQHEVRTKDLVSRLAAKGMIAEISPQATFTSYCTEAFGTKFQQRQLNSHGWNLGFVQGEVISNRVFFSSLGKLLDYLERTYLPKEEGKWELFDDLYNDRIKKIRDKLGKANGTMTIATSGVVEPAAWILQVFENGESLGNPVVSKGFEKLSQLLAFMEERLKIK